MALYYTLPVYKDTLQLVLLLFRLTSGFNREYKYSLGQDIKRDSIVLVRHIYRANSSKDKYPHLQAFIDDFEILRFQIRLCYELRIISSKQLAEVIALSESINKQVYGWRGKKQSRDE